MSTIANPIPGYYGAPTQPYHSSSPGKYNRTILASATFIATGSNAGCVAFYQSGSSAASVTLLNGGTFTVPAIGPSASAAIYEMGVYSVTAGSVYLLYR
jgi:hypothetical protein